MTRRVLAAISVLALATVAPLALFPGSATAQDPDYIYHIDTSGPVNSGSILTTRALIDNPGGMLIGWSIAICLDGNADFLEVTDGTAPMTGNGGGPADFVQTDLFPGFGVRQGVVINFAGLNDLPIAEDHEAITMQTELLGPPGTTAVLSFCPAGYPFDSSFTENLVVAPGGIAILPTVLDGTISIIDCTETPAPPTNLTCVIDTGNGCQCQALLEWQAPTSLIYSFEIYVDGLLATAVSPGATSAVIPLPTSDPSEICIRARCQDLFSPLVCCTVECQPDLDCNNNGVPDLCDIAQGDIDCNGNGELDECEIATGSVPDCNSNGVPDECDAGTTEPDCNLNNIPDVCEIADGTEFDCDLDGVPDSCKSGPFFDCNNNGIPDECDYNNGTSFDCNNNGFLDDCEIAQGFADDCDINGIPDECDIAAGAADADGDGIPDVCTGQNFIRGECNGDDSITIADAIFLLGFLFNSGPAPTCQDACDINDDSGIDISDGVYLLAYLFSAGPNPQNPFPDCGIDPTLDALECDAFAACP
ncbi:MAG: hypothetical protein AAEJ46_13390 [Planctomycetota bacterium]